MNWDLRGARRYVFEIFLYLLTHGNEAKLLSGSSYFAFWGKIAAPT